ncbi:MULTISPECIES: hypothetical protein [unclassified Nonomuraea]|uniref:hypothetical protein n=1 Tax=unclassified Nonomuraea TaxID=2593643 RepID=UPI0033C9683C
MSQEADRRVEAAKEDAREAWAQVAEHERARGAAEQARDDALGERDQAQAEQHRTSAAVPATQAARAGRRSAAGRAKKASPTLLDAGAPQAPGSGRAQ